MAGSWLNFARNFSLKGLSSPDYEYPRNNLDLLKEKRKEVKVETG